MSIFTNHQYFHHHNDIHHLTSPTLITIIIYEFPSFRVNSKVCKTNTPSNTAFRAFGAPPAMTITENMIYDACVEINLDPLQFRRDNLQRAGWENHYGQVTIINITTNFI